MQQNIKLIWWKMQLCRIFLKSIWERKLIILSWYTSWQLFNVEVISTNSYKLRRRPLKHTNPHIQSGETFPKKIKNISLHLCLIQTFIKGKFEFCFKMAKLFLRSCKIGKPFPNEILGNNEKYPPLSPIELALETILLGYWLTVDMHPKLTLHTS